MGQIRDAAGIVYADGPSSNPDDPHKPDIRSLFGIVEDLVLAAENGMVRAETWTVLNSLIGTRVGQPGQVTTGSGTHTDPVSGSTVPNKGEYRWSASPAGWRWVSDLLDTATLSAEIDTKADQADLAAEIAAREAILPPATAMPPFLPVVVSDGNASLWLLNGDLDAKGMAPALRRKAVADIVSRSPEGSRVPLIAAGSKVLLWIQDGILRGPGINDAGNEAAPLATDGRSLYRVRQQIARVKAGVAGAKVKIALAGDSWSEMTTIATALRSLLDVSMDLTGEGWQSVKGDFLMGGVTFAKSAGWTVLDASTNSSWPYGVGADGHNIHTNGGSETVTIGNLQATAIRIYSHQHGGTWRYRVDGGSWTTVPEGSDGSLKITTISGLSDTTHTLEIDTTGNGGIVSLAGFYSTRAVAGAEVLKIGNSGLTGYRLRDFAPLIGAQFADMQPDLLIVNLGTNDYRNGYSTVQTYVDGLAALTTAARGAIGDIGIIFVVPPQSDGTVVTPLSLYRDAAYDVAKSRGCELLNMLDQFGGYTESSARGQWDDSLHLSAAGAGCLTTIINNSFIGL